MPVRRHRLVDLQPARRPSSSSAPGPVFANLLLADEINRAPPKTQAALLEAMQERQVTIEGETHPLERPFLVLATQNPIEYEGTYPLPEAQLDRFLLRIAIGYPDRDDEWRCSTRRGERKHGRGRARAGRRRADALAMQRGDRGRPRLGERRPATWSTSSRRRATARASQVGASPRGSLALLKLSRCRAALARPRLRHCPRT